MDIRTAKDPISWTCVSSAKTTPLASSVRCALHCLWVIQGIMASAFRVPTIVMDTQTCALTETLTARSEV